VKRWEDVRAILAAGIDVYTTMNVQHLESLNDQVWQISGVRVRETVPDWVMKEADEVVMVDVTPRALVHRLERGVVYAPDKAQRALANFFQESTLAALRELAMRQTAHEVDVRHPAEPSHREGAPRPRREERILICVGPEAASAALIRRGRRVADFVQAECFALFVRATRGEPVSDSEREAVERHLNFARNLHIETRVLEGDDVAATIVDFARMYQITQLFMGRPRNFHRLPLMGRNLVQRVVELARDMQITIVAERRRVS
jgi:two-component system sensor histidine kinase KdpD